MSNTYVYKNMCPHTYTKTKFHTSIFILTSCSVSYVRRSSNKLIQERDDADVWCLAFLLSLSVAELSSSITWLQIPEPMQPLRQVNGGRRALGVAWPSRLSWSPLFWTKFIPSGYPHHHLSYRTPSGAMTSFHASGLVICWHDQSLLHHCSK